MISIYIYENLINGKVYIGQTIDLKRRDYLHIYDGKNSMHIDRSINKYGRDNFSLNVITSSDSQEAADEDEKYWITRARELLGRESVYNITDGGEHIMSGRKHTQEAKEKISKANKGRKHSEESIKNMSGKKHSEEHKNKVSKSLIGNKRCVGRVPWNKDKPNCFSEETRKKMSDSHKGQPSSRSGKTNSEEHKNKVSKARKGVPWSEARRLAQRKRITSGK
jgi:group I intron endonuclease